MSWYNPKEASRVLEAGEYDGTIESAEHQTSKAGNPMVKMGVRVYSGEGDIVLYDYLVSGLATTWKIAAFASAMGKSREFEVGQFDPLDLIGTNVRVRLVVKKSPEYGDKNQIAGYSLSNLSKPKTAPAAKPSQPAKASKPTADIPPGTTIDEDDIPF